MEADARIYTDLKADHDRQRQLIVEVREAAGSERTERFEALRKELQAHAAAEETSLYAVMLANPELRDEARHSVAEHKEVDDLLGELLELDISSSGWDAKFDELVDRYIHHIGEEEEDMFPAASQALGAPTEEKLAQTYDERKPAELERAETEMPGDERE